MEKQFRLTWKGHLFGSLLLLFAVAVYVEAGPLGGCPESNQSEKLNDRCRLRKFVHPRDQNALLQCSSATSYDIRDALVRYAYRRCQYVLFLDIVSFFGNETLDLAEDVFDSIPAITTHLQLWGLTWIIPKNWNELTPFVITNTIRQLHLVNMRFVPPDNVIPFDLFKGLDKVERIAIFHTELPLIEDGFFEVFPKLSCLKLYNVSIPCMCSMKWFHTWLVTNQFIMIFNGDMDCGMYNTNCYGNGLDGVWLFSPDVDTTLNACNSSTTLTAKSISLMNPGALTGSDVSIPGLNSDHSATDTANLPVAAEKALYDVERSSDLQQLDPVALDCLPGGFRILIPLRISPVTKAEFWNFGNASHCTSGGNVESSDRMLVLTSNYTSCGTTLTEDEETINFQNVVVVEHPQSDEATHSLIERVAFSMIPVVCTFLREDHFSFLQTSDLQPSSIRRMKDPLSGVNRVKVKIEIVNAVASAMSNTFSFDIFAEAVADPRLSLMVERLFATSTNNSADAVKYDIISDGCPKDATLKSSLLTTGKVGFRFTMTPFKFRNTNSSEVYLHGHVLLCNSFSEKCEFDCASRGRSNMLPVARSLDGDFDIVKYSKAAILKAAELI